MFNWHSKLGRGRLLLRSSGCSGDPAQAKACSWCYTDYLAAYTCWRSWPPSCTRLWDGNPDLTFRFWAITGGAKEAKA